MDGDLVRPEDLPRKILDHVGDIEALPEVEECADEIEPMAHEESCHAAPAADHAAPVVESDVPDSHAVQVVAPQKPGSFVWPDLAVLEAQALNLKDFLDAVESRLIDEALGRAEGVKNQAAELLGIKRTTLIEKLKKRNA